MKFTQFLSHFLNPALFFQAVKFKITKTRTSKTELNPQLELYSDFLPSEHIHYGFFENPEWNRDAISFEDLARAQEGHVTLLLNHLPEEPGPVLDIGCGKGGLLKVLRRDGYDCVGLTPDRAQVQYVREEHPDQEMLQSKAETMDTEKFRNRFGTVINLESLQYIDLQEGFGVVEEILRNGGRWIVSDYFRKDGDVHEDSGHRLNRFLDHARTRGWNITVNRNITENVLPTLEFAGNLVDRILMSGYEYGVNKLHNKWPFLYRLLKFPIQKGRERIHEEKKTIDPEIFRRDKTYRLFVLEKESHSTTKK